MTSFEFAFDERYRKALLGLGITTSNTWLRLDDSELTAHCSIFTLRTPRTNVASAQVTGPHRPIRALGIRTSLTDRGLTFGTNAERMVCIRFVEPVRTSPFDLVAHPGLSVSVADVDGLVAALRT